MANKAGPSTRQSLHYVWPVMHWQQTSDLRAQVARVARFAFGASLAYLLASTFWYQDANRSDYDSLVDGLLQCSAREEQRVFRNLSQIKSNPRLGSLKSRQDAVIIKNATLFDGETMHIGSYDIGFVSGLFRYVSESGSEHESFEDAQIYDVKGSIVTPGLVDMHSHHLLLPYPGLSMDSDVNERPLLGPITPFVRSIDGFKAYDPAILAIASGGVTSSLILPGSANIIGGEAYLVKNLPIPGKDGEPLAAELLLDHGIPEKNRQRYLKMACGENPKGIHGHTRLGLTWLLRQHLDKARQLQIQQDDWCERVSAIRTKPLGSVRHFSKHIERFPSELEYATSVALIRGQLNVNIHCYEPQDIERILDVLHEFNVHPQAFHHALGAWQIPNYLRNKQKNITIATFADNGLFKTEAYSSNLRAPKILDDHGVRVAFKSDHTGEGNNAKYLAHQASISYGFGLSEQRALQAITSIPARSLGQHDRIGFIQPGYDADVVVWNDHPLQIGATPNFVFIDGRMAIGGQTDETISGGKIVNLATKSAAPAQRHISTKQERDDFCNTVRSTQSTVIFTGIRKMLVDHSVSHGSENGDTVLLVENGRATCLGSSKRCLRHDHPGVNVSQVNLDNGYVTPSLLAFGGNLGIRSVFSEKATGDSPGTSGNRQLRFAKYAVHFGDRVLSRARIGGITKAISAPLHTGGTVQGVSVGIRIGEYSTVAGDGIWKGEIALHLVVGQASKGKLVTPAHPWSITDDFDKGSDALSAYSGFELLRQILDNDDNDLYNSHGVYSRVANGSLPVVVQAFNEDDISQLILIKKEFPSLRLIIYGGHGAPLVANELASARIPVILTGNRGAPDSWEKRNSLTGPPLTLSPAKVLYDAGVTFGLAISGDSKVHSLAQEAQWAARYIGLSETEAIGLVSTVLKDILGIRPELTSTSESVDDLVLWDGNPLKGEGTVALTIKAGGEIMDCSPEASLDIL